MGGTHCRVTKNGPWQHSFWIWAYCGPKSISDHVALLNSYRNFTCFQKMFQEYVSRILRATFEYVFWQKVTTRTFWAVEMTRASFSRSIIWLPHNCVSWSHVECCWDSGSFLEKKLCYTFFFQIQENKARKNCMPSLQYFRAQSAFVLICDVLRILMSASLTRSLKFFVVQIKRSVFMFTTPRKHVHWRTPAAL